MDFNDNLPIYIQIMNLIKGKIVSGEIGKGDKLPSVREFSKKLKVNPNTVQRTYQELEREGLVFTQRGMGTFVTEDKEVIKKFKKGMATNIVNNFLIEMKKLGFTPSEIMDIISEWIEKEERE
ncbi:MAG: GntR family transcriptional regulator [Tissierellia bacterium]|nr:GntR family transcriptional regulator [Tissierellia bacterium]